ncbi:MAG TPA: purine-nucleoside phosphorylase [Actinomycetota bacterium]|nr:purine-nucleoside phosphorylase [Actinomycetota bacterium]
MTSPPQARVAIVLGSGLSEVARTLVPAEPIPYSSLEGMAAPTAGGHEGALYTGKLEGVPTLIFAGRLHLYEGHEVTRVVQPVRLAHEAGCDTIILTNASGGIDPSLPVGGFALISDHLNLTGTNPLLGHADTGTRFLDLTEVYDAELRALARAADPTLKEGVYAGLIGPVYETPAEIRMLRAMGADLVGMSTVLEAIEARRLGMRVLGLSLVTNAAAGLSSTKLEHEEVSAAGRAAAGRLEGLLRKLVADL